MNLERRRYKFAYAAISAAVLLLSNSGRADQVAINPAADATLYQVTPLNSSGGWESFIAGTTQNGTLNRALLRFDLASVVPAGSIINEVTLNIDVTRRPGCGFETSQFGLHRMLQSWGEGTTVPLDNPGGMGAPADIGDATWNYRFAFSNPWSVPGGAADVDYVADFSSAVPVADIDLYQFEGTPVMVSDVQYWLDHPEANFGWMLKQESEELTFTARRFASRENPSGGPLLIIDFTPVPEPGTITLLALGAFGIFAFRRSRRQR
jgi:hypothetical protein